MSKIILFQGGIETLAFFSKEIGKTLEKLGHSVFYYDLDMMNVNELKSFISGKELYASKVFRNEEMFQSYQDEKKEDASIWVISFNFNGIRGEEELYEEDGGLLWKKYQIPVVNIMVDHPFYYAESLEKMRKELGNELYHQICIDRDHKKYMEHFYPKIKKIAFMPLAGTKIIADLEKEREYDVVMTGNYTPPKDFDKYIERIDEEYEGFYRSIIQYLINHPMESIEKVMEKFLLQEIPELTDEEMVKCMENMIFIDLYVRFYYRGEVVKKLVQNGIKVHVFGAGWDLLELTERSNLILEGPTDSMGCLKAMTKAKIALNVMPWFKDGAHDRIFNGMLNGAVVATDESRYLKEELQEAQIFFYSLLELEQLPERVKELLVDENKRKGIQKEGAKYAEKKHTWKERARFLSEYMEKYDEKWKGEKRVKAN